MESFLRIEDSCTNAYAGERWGRLFKGAAARKQLVELGPARSTVDGDVDVVGECQCEDARVGEGEVFVWKQLRSIRYLWEATKPRPDLCLLLGALGGSRKRCIGCIGLVAVAESCPERGTSSYLLSQTTVVWR